MSDEPGSLPDAPLPQGSYVAVRLCGGFAFTAGMTPRRNGQLVVTGRIGVELDVATGRHAAHQAARNALAALKDALGSLDLIDSLAQMTVYVACSETFEHHSIVADGASDAVRSQLGERGACARAAVGVVALPGGAPVEVTLVASYRDTEM